MSLIRTSMLTNPSAVIMRLTALGAEAVADRAAMYPILWAYYLNNGLYEEIRNLGRATNDFTLKEIRNPARRAADFYPAMIWPGALPRALPVVAENQKILPALEKLWTWSNWSTKKQVMVRWAAVAGDVFIKVAQPDPVVEGAEAPKRVYLQLIDPQYVTDAKFDERGYIVECRIDVAREEAKPTGRTRFIHTESWTLSEGLRTWTHKKTATTPLDELGEPDLQVPLGAWGIDFIPIVHAKHLDLGDEFGVGAFTLALSKIDELNLVATRLHAMLFRHNDVTWALQANAMDASGRPLPAPRIGDSVLNTDSTTVTLGGEKLIRLPGQSTLAPMVPALDYSAMIAAIQELTGELRQDLPELNWYGLDQAGSDLSGRAIRLLMAPALAVAGEVRGNMEAALIRAHQMALTIGQAVGAWKEAKIADFGTYAAGDFDHEIAERPFIPRSREEIAELAALEKGAGIPTATSLRNSGWTDEDLERMADDAAEEREAANSSLGAALMNAQARLNAGQATNGMEAVGGPEEGEAVV